MTGTQLATTATLVAILTAIISTWFMYRTSVREGIKRRQEEIKAAIAAAVAPKDEQIRQLAAERDYLRNRVDLLEDDARRKRGN